jgi:hypothetical protein
MEHRAVSAIPEWLAGIVLAALILTALLPVSL